MARFKVTRLHYTGDDEPKKMVTKVDASGFYIGHDGVLVFTDLERPVRAIASERWSLVKRVSDAE